MPEPSGLGCHLGDCPLFGNFHNPGTIGCISRPPDTIDWSGPAVEIRDTLVEAWFTRRPTRERDSDTLAMAEEWADEMFAQHAD